MSNQVVLTEWSEAAERYQVALTGAETGGQLSVRVNEVEPGRATPLHIHVDQSETFHVIEGQFRFQVGERVVEAGPGFTAFIPKNTPHSFRYDGKSGNGRLMSILSPGIHDGFITEMPAAEARGVSKDEMNEIANRNGVQIIGPSLPKI